MLNTVSIDARMLAMELVLAEVEKGGAKKMTTKESLAVAISELIKRMSPDERMELTRHISWRELEEWKATQETLADRELMANLKKGLKGEEKGGLKEVRL